MRCLWLLMLSGALCLALIGCKKGGDAQSGPTDAMLETKAKMQQQYAGKRGPMAGVEGGAGGMKAKMGQTAGPTASTTGDE
ncbi:MAG TPA: hypothetical protein PLD23_03770 [Armatimonadota bacterium]|nr:hypothetical protein [Armatimonadota bacterium]